MRIVTHELRHRDDTSVTPSNFCNTHEARRITHGGTNGRTNGRARGRTHRRADGLAGRRTDGRTDAYLLVARDLERCRQHEQTDLVEDEAREEDAEEDEVEDDLDDAQDVLKTLRRTDPLSRDHAEDVPLVAGEDRTQEPSTKRTISYLLSYVVYLLFCQIKCYSIKNVFLF